jgi:hypothetical protein
MRFSDQRATDQVQKFRIPSLALQASEGRLGPKVSSLWPLAAGFWQRIRYFLPACDELHSA